MAARLRCQVDKLVNDEQVNRALRLLPQDEANREANEPLISDILTVVSKELNYSSQHGVPYDKWRPFSARKEAFTRFLIGELHLRTVDVTPHWLAYVSWFPKLCIEEAGDSYVSWLASALKSGLTSLEIGFCRLGDAAFESLAAALAENSTLVYLDVHKAEISEDSAAKLAVALEENSTLERVHFRLCSGLYVKKLEDVIKKISTRKRSGDPAEGGAPSKYLRKL